MKFLFFGGCKIEFYLQRYKAASKTILDALGVTVAETEFTCCGYPIRHQSRETAFLSAARNLSIAAKQGLHLVTPCKCCYGNFKHAMYWMARDNSLRDVVVSRLAREGLRWDADAGVKHLLQVLHEDVGVETIRKRIKQPLSGLKLAAHYGCHALRPVDVVQFDTPFAPTLFESLIEVTGAETLDWSHRLACCGNPLQDKNNALSRLMLEKKISSAVAAGADAVCTACTYCQIQFESVDREERQSVAEEKSIQAVLYPEILGKALGLDI